MPDQRVLKGSCACGMIHYEITGERRDVVACHCVSCRKQSGHYAAATLVPHDGFKITKGKAALKWWDATPEAKRGFCRDCGSLLFWQKSGRDNISVFAGSLDGDTGLNVVRHIFAGEKGDYYNIIDDVPVLREYEMPG
ncbi:MAG: GFA family protein [Pseudomonadota bacterium]